MSIVFTLNGQRTTVTGVPTTTTLLDWLRAEGHTGTKEGCAEGDCGACTVAWLDQGRWRAVNSCLVLLPQCHGRELMSVEGLQGERLHPAQSSMVQALGSQCGYCTPGFVMSLFEATYRDDLDADWKLDDQLCGNLCRCTGYRPIRDALSQVAGTRPDDAFLRREGSPTPLPPTDYACRGQLYLRPGSLEELWRALEDHPEARLVQGATDLGLEVTKRGVRHEKLIDLGSLTGLQQLEAGELLRIGAGVRLTELEPWAARELPVLARMLRYFAARQIKNRATVGGNLCNASPIGDLAPVLMALDAVCVLASRAGTRRVPLHAFFLGYRQTALQAGEILLAVELARPGPNTRLGAYKVSRRRELDISAVCAGMAVTVEGGLVTHARLAYGGMAATTKRAEAAEAALLGSPWTMETLERAREALDFTPMSDHRGSAWYRSELASNLLLGFFEETRDQPFVELPRRPSGSALPGGEA
jgi:xanthine dehydrogenase small subunit